MGQRLAGKVALITGGAGGIGAATARLFCAEGAAVALVDVNAALVEQTAQQVRSGLPAAQVHAFAADIADAASAEGAVAGTVAALGGLHVLINNAAVRAYGPLAEAQPDAWRRILDVNLLGAANCVRAAVPHLRQSGRGAIVNVSSTFAVVGRPGMGLYDATKAALISLTRVLAIEEAPHGIRVNAVCPGSTWTPYVAGRAAVRGLSEQELRESGAVNSLLGRWAEPDEIAYPILWLASDEASFVTGTSLLVDGGASATSYA